jgi:hypothetical protein
MEEQDKTPENIPEDPGTPASDLVPDRDVLMMEKPLASNRASKYRPADKKLLRNIVIVLLFLIAVLLVLTWIGRKDNSPALNNPSPAGSAVETGTE